MRVTQNKMSAWEWKNGYCVCCVMKTLQQQGNASIYVHLPCSFLILYLWLNLAFCGLLGPQKTLFILSEGVLFFSDQKNFNETCLQSRDTHLLIGDKGDKEKGGEVKNCFSVAVSFSAKGGRVQRGGEDRRTLRVVGQPELSPRLCWINGLSVRLWNLPVHTSDNSSATRAGQI